MPQQKQPFRLNWFEYCAALTIVAVVVALAWHAGRNRPVPGWITHGVIPVLGWIYIAYGAWLVLRHFRRK